MTVGVFDPQGTIAGQERDLIILAISLMLLIAIPMLILLYTFAWKYRAGNKKNSDQYQPEHVGGVWKQLLWWVIPASLIVVLATINWKTTHALDPFKPIVSPKPPITVEVIALTWKWLFIYPQQGIATVNYLEFPEQTPVHFELTADAPMSSFWIPQLGSQIYAMDAMQTQIYLEASSTGKYVGKDTEINGAGYAGMTFTAKSVSQSDFNDWVASVKASSSAPSLTMGAYQELWQPSTYVAPEFFSSVDPGLYNYVLMKYMVPSSSLMMQGIAGGPASGTVMAPTGTIPGSTIAGSTSSASSAMPQMQM